MPRPAWVIAESAALGHRIAISRAEAGLSQEALGDLAGVERRTIQRYEVGLRDPRYADLLLIASALQVPLSRLVPDVEPRPVAGDADRPGR
ncbi:helix-turn-helix domain-containing protein [Streptomyces corynorhini]|nr:helix-turn-helix transcriptional regulator [Streptomyces corynorhini]